MTRVQSIAASCAAVLAACAITAAAQNLSQSTYLTFSDPVELPGVTLEPGTYEFRVADTPQRNVIRVYEKDREAVVGQWSFVFTERPRATGETVVTFREEPEGSTPAVQYWYYPGEKLGKEFVYPDDQAEQIADRTGQTVRAESGPVRPSGRAEGEGGSAADDISRSFEDPSAGGR